MKTKGRIHSYEVGSAVDGPGLRFVVFTQGCPLRCLYCHNPDTRDPLKGKEITAEEIVFEINKYHSYFDHGNGGLTVSGGEPLLQAEFVASIFQLAKSNGIHTCLDTSGFASHHQLETVAPHTDLVLLDIKSSDPSLYHRLTHVDLDVTLATAHYLESIQKPFWVRFVLVPGLTDSIENVKGVAKICSEFNCLERIEILPFHKLGAYKWKELGLNFDLELTEPASIEQVEAARAIFRKELELKSKVIPII